MVFNFQAFDESHLENNQDFQKQVTKWSYHYQHRSNRYTVSHDLPSYLLHAPPIIPSKNLSHTVGFLGQERGAALNIHLTGQVLKTRRRASCHSKTASKKNLSSQFCPRRAKPGAWENPQQIAQAHNFL